MGIRDTKMEEELETNIIDYLKDENGYIYIDNNEMKGAYNRQYAFDEVRLLEFIQKSQPSEYEILSLDTVAGKDKFFKQLDHKIRKEGIVSVLKNGIKCYPSSGTIIFYHALDLKRPSSYEEFKTNIFAVTNQLTYSDKNRGLELNLAIMINGLPIMTMELKSRASSSGWTYKDAEEQYMNDRDAKETLFTFKRCMAHFAVDENFISFTTRIDGKNTRFMPFNKGTAAGGSGNPVNPLGTMTDYLWKEFLKKETLTSLIRDFAYVSVDKVKHTEALIFPLYHQYRAVTRLVEDVKEHDVGNRYLIQHSAGSGKSNSITWLAYRLVEVSYDDKKAFDSAIVVTDRLNLDKQIEANIRKFIDEKSIVGHANSSTDLKNLLTDGKKIIITTVQKFPFLLEKIGTYLQGRNFAIIIDEAHSSQSGKAAASLNMAVSGGLSIDDKDMEDHLNELIEARKMPENASFFAFTATPKAKTIEMFGSVFDLYSMKQAIEEGFILDVLKNYTHYENYYKVYKTIESNPDFDKKKSQYKIRNYVEGQEFPIREKAEVMVKHFLTTVAPKINGKAKAMIITQSILRAIEYYNIISDILKRSNTGFEAVIAFSGEKEYKGKVVTETSLNGFSDKETPERFKEDKYKFLIVADKYQTGYDEPLLHTMYVDKVLNDVKAVQTLSRLNRSAKYKIDTCVIDFANKPEHIQEAFQPYYRETKLEEETDPNKLNNLLGVLDGMYVYEEDEDGTVEGLGIGTGRKGELELDSLENIIKTFNDVFGNIEWKDKDNVARQIKELPDMVMKNDKFRNALKNSDLENIKREYETALSDVFGIIMWDNMQLFGEWTNNSDFSKWLSDLVFDEIMNRKNKQG